MGVETSLGRAVDFLCAQQLSSGEFPADRYDSPDLTGPATADSSPFTTTFAVYALALVPSAAARAAMEQGMNFLLSERRDPGLWTYWSRKNPMAISADVDVTSCAAFLVRKYRSTQHMDGVDPLLCTNQTVRGRFKTWFRELHDRNDVSPCANANVLMYLGDRVETQQSAAYLTRLLTRGEHRGSDWYYADPNALYYMASRAYREGALELAGCVDAVRDSLLKAEFASSLSGALALCALRNVDGPTSRVEEIEAYLVSTQSPDGGWPAAPFYAGPEPPEEHRFWWGSRALTTALCVEALAPRRTADTAA